jgi:hypothetical protein
MSAWVRWSFVAVVLMAVGWAFWFGLGPGKASVADWRVDGTPDPAATEVSILVHENACASGQSADGRIQEPDVDYRRDAVVVTVRVRQRSSSEACQGNPDTPYILRLDEPLGDRMLLDGGTSPPAPPDPPVG